MRAVWLDKHGGPEVLRVVDRPEPSAGPEDALIEVMACGINHLDLWVRKGGPRGFPLPLVLGSDAAGVVEKAPPGSGLEAGGGGVIYPAPGCGAPASTPRADGEGFPRYLRSSSLRCPGFAEEGG